MQEKPSPELSQRHRRGIASTLAILDEALCEFEEWALGREIRSVLYSETNSLTPEQRERLLHLLKGLRATMMELCDHLGLEGKVNDAVTAIWSRCSTLWVSLVELESRYLKRYGEIPDDFPEYFDPKIAHLIEGLQSILKMLKIG